MGSQRAKAPSDVGPIHYSCPPSFGLRPVVLCQSSRPPFAHPLATPQDSSREEVPPLARYISWSLGRVRRSECWIRAPMALHLFLVVASVASGSAVFQCTRSSPTRSADHDLDRQSPSSPSSVSSMELRRILAGLVERNYMPLSKSSCGWSLGAPCLITYAVNTEAG